MAKLTTQQLEQIIREAVREVKKKKRKPNCIKGNPFHSASTGKFVSPEDEKGSWSLGKGNKGGKDCEWGQSKRPQANRREVWTKTPCGRKGKYKCADGTVKESGVQEEALIGPSGEVLNPELKDVSDGALVEEIEKRMREGKMSSDYLLRVCSAINRSAAGNYPDKP